MVPPIAQLEPNRQSGSISRPFPAKSIAYSDSASGVYIERELFKKLGIAEQVKPKAHMIQKTPVASLVASGEYDRILRGEFVRRGPDTPGRPLMEDMAAAGSYYAGEARVLATQVADAAKRAAERAREAFRNAQNS